jgi:hypothetical protein
VTIVVDVGCARWGDSYSLERLVEMYRPHLLIGIDPHVESSVTIIDGTVCLLKQGAAWVDNRMIGWVSDMTRSRVAQREEPPEAMVRTIDLPLLLDGLASLDHDVVVKIDAEGAEHTLIPKIVEAGVDLRIRRLLVEWHGDDIEAQEAISDTVRCSVETWRW